MDIKLLDRGMDYSVYLIKFKKNIENRSDRSKISNSVIEKILANKFKIKSKICRTHTGKPFIQKENIFISISYSYKYILVCISSVPVGIDIEENRFYYPRKCYNLILTAGERKCDVPLVKI
ncbi:hypothetical protein LGVB_01580 (plasmid) [Lactobacillus gasseri]|mgnify:CR=1 FL=1|uniref:hypothetical protein n=1 Tax=Lactobacillus TaxID=1578 RepID=UPI0006682314|nr:MULTISPECIES: hypothetical protein [Lactobacillus]MBS7524790.1 hypothetical protein [Lactobacillus gasseri]MBS7524953.1 hypothetical protein [Lactobacillus gasseri]MCZ3542467.1 hypothetical protein [Lactobacillus gasseri]MCZ3590925.1 hypothetical protein [Lactobacillus gasseri]UWI44375.1 hypothetical protein HR119_09275 [Lactobacillus paragasseri]